MSELEGGPRKISGGAGGGSSSADPDEDPVVLLVTRRMLDRVLGWIRHFLGWTTYGYLVGLLLTLSALEWWGERNWLLSIFLYAPPQVLLLPLAVLSPLCLLFRPRLLGWHFTAIFLLLFVYMGFRWSWRPTPGPSTVTGVTFNLGESNRAQFTGFLAQEKPDFLVMQDAYSRGDALARTLPGMNVSTLGQFVLASRFPILKAGLVEEAKVGKVSVAARWEVEIQHRPVAIYSVHLPPPRHELSRFLGGRRLVGDLLGVGNREAAFGNYREWLDARIQLARDLSAVLAQEKLPMIVGGDFNTPDHGYIHRLFSGEMTDAFAAAGRGWGLSFPGSTRNPLSLFGPWLRIDYFFAGRDWRVTECRPEPGGKSQHKAVLARFEPAS